MAEDGVGASDGLGAPIASRGRVGLDGAEWAVLLAWPWVLTACVACVVTGRTPSVHPAAVVLPAGIAALAFLGVPIAGRPQAAPSFALAAGALAAPALAGCECLDPHSGAVRLALVLAGCALLALSAYAFALVRAVAGRAYSAAAAAWLGAPPLLSYLLLDILSRRADALLALSPASGAAWAFSGEGAPDWSRLGSALGGLAIVGACLTVLPVTRRHSAGS